MSLTAETREVISTRNAKIYAEWIGGKQYNDLSLDYDLSMSSIKRILMEYGIDHNLPNGRKRAIADVA
jgi:Mor family transcriptional regulator